MWGGQPSCCGLLFTSSRSGGMSSILWRIKQIKNPAACSAGQVTHPQVILVWPSREWSLWNPTSWWSLECDIHQIELSFSIKDKHLLHHLISHELGRDERGSIRTSPSPQKPGFWRVIRMPRVNINQLLKSKEAFPKNKLQSLSTQTGASVT